MLVLYDIARVYDKIRRRQSTYCDGQGLTVGLHNFPGRVRTAANISQDLLGNEGMWCTCWT